MTKNSTKIKAKANLESRVKTLEAKVVALERVSKKYTRKKREYTDEERAAVRARLLAGQEAARKKREAEAKAVVKTVNSGTKELKPAGTAK